jgi:hypothetical protein
VIWQPHDKTHEGVNFKNIIIHSYQQQQQLMQEWEVKFVSYTFWRLDLNSETKLVSHGLYFI